MYWKIEPSGCFVVKKEIDEIALQIRYSIFLSPKDPNFDSTYLDEYKLIESSKTKLEFTSSDYVKTGKKILVPLHNHIILLPITTDINLINTVGDQVMSIVKNYNENNYYKNGKLVFIPNTLPKYDKFSIENEKKANELLINILNTIQWQK